MNLKELYQEIILEHGKNQRNLRKTEGFNKAWFTVAVKSEIKPTDEKKFIL